MDLKSAEQAVRSYREEDENGDLGRLDLFLGIWRIQAEYEKDVTYEVASFEDLKTEFHAKRPFFQANPPQIPLERFLELADRISAYLLASEALDGEQKRMIERLDMKELVSEKDLERASYDLEGLLGEKASEFDDPSGMEVVMFSLVLASSLRPFLDASAQANLKTLGHIEQDVYKARRCPNCGNEPTLSYVGETIEQPGMSRSLWCSLCHSMWDFERIFCARCGIKRQEKLHYKHLEGDAEHRIHVCDECHGYIRTFFQADSNKPISLPVEDIVMTYLDAVALDKGLTTVADRDVTPSR